MVAVRAGGARVTAGVNAAVEGRAAERGVDAAKAVVVMVHAVQSRVGGEGRGGEGGSPVRGKREKYWRQRTTTGFFEKRSGRLNRPQKCGRAHVIVILAGKTRETALLCKTCTTLTRMEL